MNVLAIGAHPDDVEIFCGGTMARLAAEGHTTFICPLTDGSGGATNVPPEEMARIRKKEAAAAAAVLGATPLWVGVPDGTLIDNEENRLKVIDVIRQARPDVIIGHTPDDYHPDHIGAAQLVFAAGFLASIPNIRTSHDNWPAVPTLYRMDTLGGLEFRPDQFVDITAFMEQKTESIRAHASQLTWLMEHDNIDVIEETTAVNRYRGLQCQTKYAEGFSAVLTYGRFGPARKLPG